MNTCQARIGYARTSTTDQNPDAQIAALKVAGCGMVRTEQKSGASLEGRPELKTILDFIHSGETLVVISAERVSDGRGFKFPAHNVAMYLQNTGA